MTRLRLNAEYCPATAAGWILTNGLGQPRFWPTVWADGLQASLESSTRGAKLHAIEKLYQSGVEQLGADRLDAILAAADTEALESILGGFLATLRNESAVDAVDRDDVWRTALTFVEDILTRLQPASDRAAARLAANLLRLQRLYRQIAPTPPRPPAPIRALPAGVVEELYDIFRPDSAQNPFRTEAGRWRNFLLFILLLHLGLRRGEVLILTADAVKDDFDPATGHSRYWINIQETPYEDDPRHSAPSIKTIPSRRQLPVSAEVLNLIDTYVQMLGDHSYFDADMDMLDRAIEHMRLASNSYLDDDLNRAIQTLLQRFDELTRFLGTEFDFYPPTQNFPRGNKYCLHPHWNIDRAGHGNPDEDRRYDECVTRLHGLCSAARTQFENVILIAERQHV